MSSNWWWEEVDAFSKMKEDEEFDCCNSKDQSSGVAGADTLPETKKGRNNEEGLTAWLLVVFSLLWTSMLAKFS